MRYRNNWGLSLPYVSHPSSSSVTLLAIVLLWSARSSQLSSVMAISLLTDVASPKFHFCVCFLEAFLKQVISCQVSKESDSETDICVQKGFWGVPSKTYSKGMKGVELAKGRSWTTMHLHQGPYLISWEALKLRWPFSVVSNWGKRVPLCCISTSIS